MNIATAIINLDAFAHNLAIISGKAPTSQVWAMVKANAYGHGLVATAKALADKVHGFGVARFEEALALRKENISTPIMLLEGFFTAKEVPALAAYNLQTVVHCHEQLEMLEQATLAKPLQVWLKIDTGMHRLGIRPEDFAQVKARLEACVNVAKPLNFISHFGCADEFEKSTTNEQITLFSELTANTQGKKSLAASSGLFFWPQSHFDMVRPGIALYGVSPLSNQRGKELGLIPAMTMKSHLIAVRHGKKGESIGYGGHYTLKQDTKLGVVAMGYGDGYPRNAPNGTPVWINGRIVPLAGRVAMDMLTVDLGASASDKVGDEVTLWGENLPVEQVADFIGTIGYELVTNITSRVALLYLSANTNGL